MTTVGPVDWTQILMAVIGVISVSISGFIAYKTLQVQTLAKSAGEAAKAAAVAAKDSATAASNDRSNVNTKLDEIHQLTNSQLEKVQARLNKSEETTLELRGVIDTLVKQLAEERKGK